MALNAAIRERVGAELDAVRSLQGKHEGTVGVEIEGFEVKSTIPKRIEWNSDILDEIGDSMVDEGGDPSEWIDVRYTVSEVKYKKMPEALRARFDTARTLKHGKEVITLEEIEA